MEEITILTPYLLSADAFKNGVTNALYIIVALLVFGLLILVHEFGHYITARLFKVTINEFAIGMGPKLISKKSKKTDIVYSLRLFPIGGFVSMAGEDEESDDENAVSKKPAWQRFIIIISGAGMNILTGIVVMLALVTFSSSWAIGGTEVGLIPDEYSTYAADSGLLVGDKIVKVDGDKVRYTTELVYTVLEKCVSPVDVEVERNGERVVLENVTFPTFEENGVTYGECFFKLNRLKKTPYNVVAYSLNTSFATIKTIWNSLIGLVSGKYGFDAVSGPVGTTTAVAESAKAGVDNLVYISVFIAMNLGVFNLLPLPALDGGRLVFILIEMIRRKPIDPKYEGYVHFAGIVLLMLLMIMITFKDVISLF